MKVKFLVAISQLHQVEMFAKQILAANLSHLGKLTELDTEMFACEFCCVVRLLLKGVAYQQTLSFTANL